MGANTWLPMASGDQPLGPRFLQRKLIWTGTTMLAWGGETDRSWEFETLNTGGIYCGGSCLTPSAIPAIHVSAIGGGATIFWPALSTATYYDTVRGSLQSLRASGGSFTIATQACIANNASSTSSSDPATPAAGDGFWYLSRAVNCGAGTYDDGTQVGSRDAEIAAAPGACQ